MDKKVRRELGSMSLKELVGLARMSEEETCDCEEHCSCEEPHLLTMSGIELYPIDARELLREYKAVLCGMHI